MTKIDDWIEMMSNKIYFLKIDENERITRYSRSLQSYFSKENKALKGRKLSDLFDTQKKQRCFLGEIKPSLFNKKLPKSYGKFALYIYPLQVTATSIVKIIFLSPYIEAAEETKRRLIDAPELLNLDLLERSFIESAPDGIYIRDLDGIILSANPKFCEMKNQSITDIIGMPFSDFLEHSSLKKQGLLSVDDFDERKHHTIIGKVKRKDGKELWVEITTSLILFEGIPFAASGIVRDVTHREAILQELKEQYRSNAALSAFISHEIRNSLTTILGYSEFLALSNTLQPFQIKQSAETIFRNAKKVQHIMDIVLETFSLEHSTKTIEIKLINPIKVISDVLNELTGLVEMKEVRITIKSRKDDYCLVKADPSRLFLVLLNTIENAIKYSKKGDVINIRVQKNIDMVDSNEKMCLIQITDQGIGIPKEELDNIFLRFYRASNVKDIKGTGIGLYLSNLYVKNMNGTIEVFSEGEGMGTIVKIYLPFHSKE